MQGGKASEPIAGSFCDSLPGPFYEFGMCPRDGLVAGAVPELMEGCLFLFPASGTHIRIPCINSICKVRGARLLRELPLVLVLAALLLVLLITSPGLEVEVNLRLVQVQLMLRRCLGCCCGCCGLLLLRLPFSSSLLSEAPACWPQAACADHLEDHRSGVLPAASQSL